jgi:hypothetical protein
MGDSQEGWAVGQDGLMLHYDGSRWNIQTTVAGKPTLNAVAFLNKKLGFVVGQNGTILKYQPGGVKSPANLKVSAAVSQTKTGDIPSWNVTFNVINDGTKSLANVDMQAELPKGYYPVKAVPTRLPPSKGAANPTPAAVSTPDPAAATPTVTVTATPGTRGSSASAGFSSTLPVTVDTYKWSKGTATWNLGSLDANVAKTISFAVGRDAIKKQVKKPAPARIHVKFLSDGNEVAQAGPYELEAVPPTAAQTTAAPVASAVPDSNATAVPNSAAPTPQPTETHAAPQTEPQKP